MPENFNGIQIIHGLTDIFVIAPHGPVVNGKPRNDLNTGKIAEMIHAELDCSVILNYSFLKPTDNNPQSLENQRLDLFKFAHAKKHPNFLNYIKDIVDSEGKTLVVWVHGIKNENILKEGREHKRIKAFKKKPSELHALIGYGQGKNPKTGKGTDRFTALEDTVSKFRDKLTDGGMNTLLTRANARDYRGRDPRRLNQWFYNLRYDFNQVESIQLEIREKDFRDTPENFKKTAKIIAKALSALVPPEAQAKKQSHPEVSQTSKTKALVPVEPVQPQTQKVDEEASSHDPLVAEALKYLKKTFRRHFHEAMIEAGRYLIKEFYGNDYTLAPQNKKVKKQSLHQLIKRLQENAGSAPSKTWVYDAVKLAVDDHFYNNEGFRTYGKLGHSHKVLLTYIKDDKIKRRLAEETVKNNYPVSKLRERIRQEKQGFSNQILTLETISLIKVLRELDVKQLKGLQKQAKRKIEHYQKQLERYKKSHDKIVDILAKLSS